MRLMERLDADRRRPERPTPRSELTFHVVAPLVIVAVAQATDPGGPGDLLLLLPAAVAFVARPLVAHFPAELFALAVAVPVNVVVGRDGDLEGAFFLTVVMVLYAAWMLGSSGRAALITALASFGPWLVATQLAPDSGIGWNAWVGAHWFTFVLGRTLHRQRELIEALEAAREELATRAVAEERRRIARELHDLAGHTVAAMALHVTGARHVLRRDVEEADAALRDAEATGRAGLDQIRSTVAALRTDERGTDPSLAGAADLPALVEQYRRAGLTVRLDVGAAVAVLEGPLGVAVHRIVRESLANVARHAPANAVDVVVGADGGEVVLHVADHGRAAAGVGDGARFGIVGMTERARALGGHLTAGPTADGWRVEARLPLRAGGEGR